MHKETFAGFWEQPDDTHGLDFFRRWFGAARRSQLAPLKKTALTLQQHLLGLLNYFAHPITNALTEGFHSKIQAIKADARGFPAASRTTAPASSSSAANSTSPRTCRPYSPTRFPEEPRLVELECVLTRRDPMQLNGFVYELLFDGDVNAKRPHLSDLLDVAALRAAATAEDRSGQKADRSGSDGDRSGVGQPSVGGQSGVGPGGGSPSENGPENRASAEKPHDGGNVNAA